jgi:hypothetical protein
MYHEDRSIGERARIDGNIVVVVGDDDDADKSPLFRAENVPLLAGESRFDRGTFDRSASAIIGELRSKREL